MDAGGYPNEETGPCPMPIVQENELLLALKLSYLLKYLDYMELKCINVIIILIIEIPKVISMCVVLNAISL